MRTVFTSWVRCCVQQRPVSVSGFRNISQYFKNSKENLLIKSFAKDDDLKLFQNLFRQCRHGHMSSRWAHRRWLRTCVQLHQNPELHGGLPKPKHEVDAIQLTADDLHNMCSDIKKELVNYRAELQDMAIYYFDGHGKAMRPIIVVLLARAINQHIRDHGERILLPSQRTIAMITEMLHAASLVHDDVIDTSDTRRGKMSVNKVWGQRKAIMAGDYILSVAAGLLSRIGNPEVIAVIAQVLMDLVQGEFMQLGAREDENERFHHYLTKTFKKTASLIAHACKAVALLGGADEALQETAFQYGRNIGIAFQLVDDLLDFVSSSNMMGKPTAADLRLGLATAPVLFAVEQFPALNPMIMRRFKEKYDVEKAFEYVHKSNGIEQTRFLAQQHCNEAIRLANTLQPSDYQKALVTITDSVLHRMK